MSDSLTERLLAVAQHADGRRCITCANAHAVAQTYGYPLPEVGRICLQLGLKITDCSLGCFGCHREEGL